MSPAPGLRNKGQSVVEQIADKRHIPNLADTRDQMVAHRNRHASGWESAVSTLEARARQVRIDAERAHHLELYSDDVRRGRATARHRSPAVTPPLPSVVEARYWLGPCLRCEVEIWVHTLRPRVPVCEKCRSRR